MAFMQFVYLMQFSENNDLNVRFKSDFAEPFSIMVSSNSMERIIILIVFSHYSYSEIAEWLKVYFFIHNELSYLIYFSIFTVGIYIYIYESVVII